ncbi:MAG TPA: adenylate/guanylate cyclase domain-containing protein [Methylomirabilota bacterium]|nr:adenylate/guanylate cyclase domain-containing protein [Methylomirabilota bacterium]
MITLRATAIMKTDISGSTARFRTLPEPDLTALLAVHRDLVTRLAAAHDGGVVKPEGDGFWLAFPSVTAGARAAMAMQEELRLAEATKGDRRLAMRIVITLGDVLHQEGALIGDAVVLASRIEALTPPDEIYLSAAAWLALNQAEVRAALVDAFTLKGFTGPVPVYRIEQTYRTRVIADQCIVITDLRGFTAVVETAPMSEVEEMLDRLHELVGKVCRDFSGVNRFSSGDSYCLTFPDAGLALAAVDRLADEWRAPGHREGSLCPMGVAVHKGVLYAFRDFLYSKDLNVAAAVERVARRTSPDDTVVLVTGQVQRDLVGSGWDERLQRVDVRPSVPDIEVYRLGWRQ